MAGSKGVFFQDYFKALTALWFSPGRFFSDLPDSLRFSRPVAFLVLSSVVFAAGNLLYLRERVLFHVAVLFLNAVAMPFVASAFGYLVMTMMMGKRSGYRRLSSIYAFSSGATLLLAWLPFSVWFIEIWKWALVGIGMVKGCSFKPLQAGAVIALSLILLMLFFWSLGPVIFWVKAAGS